MESGQDTVRALPRACAVSVFTVALAAALTLACGCIGKTNAKRFQATPAHRQPSSQPSAPEVPAHPAIQFDKRTRLRPLTRTEGQQVIVEHDDFIRRLSPLDRQLRLHTRDPVDTAKFLEHAKAQVLEWTPQYLRILRNAVELVQQRLQEAEIELDLPPEITVVLTTGLEEGMNRAVAYVRGTSIFLNRMALIVDLPHTVAHELLHLYTGTHADKQPQLYKLIGFEKEPDFRLSADLEARRITNPDEMYCEQKIEVEYQDKMHWVIPVMLATGAYSEGDFYDQVDVRWVTIEQTPPLLLRTQELTGLYAKIGHNTAYVLGPEEILAENFALAIERRELPTPDIAVGVLDIIRGRSKPRLSAQDEAAAADKELRKTFEAWLEAQNRGDFKAYSALYAQRFVGIKHSGALSYRMDRKGWLADRAPAFEHPMTVEARKPVVTIRGNAGMIYFTQHRTSGTSEDRAPKRIEMVHEPGSWLISSEVRLQPNLLRSSKGGEVAFVGDLAKPYAMLDVVDRQGLRHGKRTLERNQLGFSVIATIPKGRAPGHAKRWVGRAVRVITDKGNLCTGRVEHLRYIARVMPHHAESRYFQGLVNDRGEEVRPPRPPPDSQILEAIWQSTHSIFVGARIALDGHCAGKPLVALPASAPIPKVAKRLDRTPRPQEVVAAFRALPEYAKEQRVCVAEKKCAAGKSWEQNPLSLDAFQFQGSTEALVSVAHFHMGCSLYVPNLWTVFGVPVGDEKAPLAVRRKPTTAAPYWIELVLDRSGSGELEYVANDGNGGLVLIGADGELLHRWAADYQSFEC